MTSHDKLKILLFGPIPNAETAVVWSAKLASLQKSKAGPFDVAFCVGKCHVDLTQPPFQNLPIPVYIHDTTAATSALPASLSSTNTNDEEETKVSDTNDNDAANTTTTEQVDQPIELAPNLFLLRTHAYHGGLWSLTVAPHKPPLVVAACPWNVRVDQSMSQHHLIQRLRHVSYLGCDLLLSHEWPQGIDSCLDANSQATCFDVAQVALHARARYHVAPGTQFHVSVPFEHLASVTNTVTSIQHVGRFVSLAPVITEKPTKQTKFVHALGIVPLHSSSATVSSETPSRPCPYTDTSYELVGGGNNDNGTAASTATTGLSEASARRILHQEKQKDAQHQQHRWNTNTTNNKRRRDNDTAGPVDPACTVLFLHGLHQDVTGRLQQQVTGDPLLLEHYPSLVRIRRPVQGNVTSSFCFLEFSTHAEAAAVLDQTGGHDTIQGVAVTLKWGKQSSNQETSNKRPKRLTESEARDSSTLYFKLLFDFAKNEAVQTAAEALRKWMEATLEQALAPTDGGEEADRVTAANEPALQVQLRLPSSEDESITRFGFLDFASHAAASMALATLTGSTDGGRLLDDAENRPLDDELKGLYLHWAKPQQDKRDEQTNVIEDPSGFQFERKHFPADARKDCWFCLASADCEKHLITGVYDSCYAAMPKGPVHPGHLLLVPVKHSSRGALTDPIVAEEMDRLKAKLRQHASTKYNMDLFVFERAIQTKHGYHTHVQCIPVERQLGTKLEATLRTQAQRAGFALQELNSDLGLQALVSSEECEGYFYVEIPIAAGKEIKRFLHKQQGLERSKVPLQFGREVLAAVMGQPDLAHWKSCVVSAEKEAEIATAFRESFASVEE